MYKVVCSDTINDLEREVAELEKKDWEPLGGIAVTHYEGWHWEYHQAMVKKNKPYDCKNCGLHR